MAGAAAKKQLERNAATLKWFLQLIVIVNTTFLLYRVAYRWDSFSFWSAFGFVLCNALAGGGFYFLRRQAVASYGDNKELVNAGSDINSKGVNEFVQDAMYWSLIVLFLSAIWDYSVWLILVIPGFGLYKLLPFLGKLRDVAQATSGTSSNAQGGGSGSSGSKNKPKVKYGRR